MSILAGAVFPRLAHNEDCHNAFDVEMLQDVRNPKTTVDLCLGRGI